MATLVFLRRRLDPLAEDGIALVLALIMLAFFSAATVTAITMTTSTQSTSVGGNASQNALAIAEAGINQTEAKLNYSNTNGTNPSGANLLGLGWGKRRSRHERAVELCLSHTAHVLR
jgi:Tfp pilus assembly protein PilX